MGWNRCSTERNRRYDYVFDSGPLILMFRHYYPDSFPTLWQRFGELIDQERIVSVKEVARELEGQEDRLAEWVKRNRSVFHQPSNDELQIVSEIFQVKHFQTLIRKQERLQGKPVADPFVIAKAKVRDGCVVTTEKLKENAAQLPNVCVHFDVTYMNSEDFMGIEEWAF